MSVDDVTAKVLAETWSATDRVVADDAPGGRARMASGIDLHSATQEEAEALVAIRIAACAPEALRLLLEAEFQSGLATTRCAAYLAEKIYRCGR